MTKERRRCARCGQETEELYALDDLTFMPLCTPCNGIIMREALEKITYDMVKALVRRDSLGIAIEGWRHK